MSVRLRELRVSRGKAIAAMRAINDAASNRAFTPEEQASYDAAEKEQDALAVMVGREERLADLAGQMAAPAAPSATLEPVVKTEILKKVAAHATPEYAAAFEAYLTDGAAALSHPKYAAALQADSNPAGGFLVMPQEMANDLIKSIDNQVFIRGLSTVRTVATAQSLGAVSLDADPADADWTSELGTGSEDSTMALGKRELHPHPVAKLIKLSRKLLRLTAGGAASLVSERLSYKFAVTEEKAFLTGIGASQPLGVFTASTLGISTGRDVSTGNTASTIVADNLFEVKYSCKGGYQNNGSWIFHRDAIKQLRKLKDTTSQYVWQPGLTAGQPDRLLDRPVYMSEYVPNTFTTGLYVGIFGDFRYYWIADALNLELQRLNELYAATNQVGFIGRKETDAMPVLEEAFARVKLG